MEAIFSAAWVIFAVPVGKFIDKFGGRISLAISEFVGIAAVLGFILSSTFVSFAIPMTLWGITAALWVPAAQTWLADGVRTKERAEAMGWLGFSRIFAFPAPFIGGFLFDRWGLRPPLLANLLGIILTFSIIVLFVPEIRTNSERAGK
ncbi:MAG: MFS transporter [Candidatus Bathyarchaeia archaeon]